MSISRTSASVILSEAKDLNHSVITMQNRNRIILSRTKA